MTILRRVIVMFAVQLPIALLAAALNTGQFGSTQGIEDAIGTSLYVTYVFGLPVILTLMAVHWVVVERTRWRGSYAPSAAVGLISGAILGITMALLQRQGAAGLDYAFLIWPAFSGLLYAVIVTAMERRAANIQS